YNENIIFFFQAEDGIRYRNVTGVQTCALPISCRTATPSAWSISPLVWPSGCAAPSSASPPRCSCSRRSSSRSTGTPRPTRAASTTRAERPRATHRRAAVPGGPGVHDHADHPAGPGVDSGLRPGVPSERAGDGAVRGRLHDGRPPGHRTAPPHPADPAGCRGLGPEPDDPAAAAMGAAGDPVGPGTLRSTGVGTPGFIGYAVR